MYGVFVLCMYMPVLYVFAVFFARKVASRMDTDTLRDTYTCMLYTHT